MSGSGGNLSQTTLFLRLLCGGYLIYLGCSILLDGAASLFIMGGAAVLILAGAGLLAITLPAVLRQIKGPEVSSDKGLEDSGDEEE